MSNLQYVQLTSVGRGAFITSFSQSQLISIGADDVNNNEGWVGQFSALARDQYYWVVSNGTLTIKDLGSGTYVTITNSYTNETGTTMVDSFFTTTTQIKIVCPSSQYTLVCNGNCTVSSATSLVTGSSLSSSSAATKSSTENIILIVVIILAVLAVVGIGFFLHKKTKVVTKKKQ
jgi:hypothetical protein